MSTFFFVPDYEAPWEATGSICQQDMHEEKMPNQENIAKFTINNAHANILEKNWEDQSIEDQGEKHARHLR